MPKTQQGLKEAGSPQRRWPVWLAAAVIVLGAVAAYHNSFGGPFIFDDLPSIAENRSIRQLWPIGRVLLPPAKGQTEWSEMSAVSDLAFCFRML